MKRKGIKKIIEVELYIPMPKGKGFTARLVKRLSGCCLPTTARQPFIEGENVECKWIKNEERIFCMIEAVLVMIQEIIWVYFWRKEAWEILSMEKRTTPIC